MMAHFGHGQIWPHWPNSCKMCSPYVKPKMFHQDLLHGHCWTSYQYTVLRFLAIVRNHLIILWSRLMRLLESPGLMATLALVMIFWPNTKFHWPKTSAEPFVAVESETSLLVDFLVFRCTYLSRGLIGQKFVDLCTLQDHIMPHQPILWPNGVSVLLDSVGSYLANFGLHFGLNLCVQGHQLNSFQQQWNQACPVVIACLGFDKHVFKYIWPLWPNSCKDCPWHISFELKCSQPIYIPSRLNFSEPV